MSEFLPKRYGVTSGYIVSPCLPASHRAPHFDVIIYDQLESPILWIEDSPDCSPRGRSLAIPAEFVHAVLEVKQMSLKSVREAIQHLGELHPLMGNEEPALPYRLFLPKDFTCACVFIELSKRNAASRDLAKSFIAGGALRGFFGGMVLRGEGNPQAETGRISLMTHQQAQSEAKAPSLLTTDLGPTREVATGLHMGTWTMWAESQFAQFAFDLLALVKGLYDPGRVSSFFGLTPSIKP